MGDLLGAEQLEESAVAHPFLLGPDRQIHVEAPDGGHVEAFEHGVQVIQGNGGFHVTERRGAYAFWDTDSVAIVSTKEGGLVPCEGGAAQLEDGRAAVKALSWVEVQEIIDGLALLNPYDSAVVSGSVVKIEDVNFDPGVQRQLQTYATSAKRYTLFTEEDRQLNARLSCFHWVGVR